MMGTKGCRQVVFVIWWPWKTHNHNLDDTPVPLCLVRNGHKGQNWKAWAVKYVHTDLRFCFWLMEQEIQTRRFNTVFEKGECHCIDLFKRFLLLLLLSSSSFPFSLRFSHLQLLDLIFWRSDGPSRLYTCTSFRQMEGLEARIENAEAKHCDRFVVLQRVIPPCHPWFLYLMIFHLKFSLPDQLLQHLRYHFNSFFFIKHWQSSLQGFISSSNINKFKSTKVIIFSGSEYFTTAVGSAVRSHNIISQVSL